MQQYQQRQQDFKKKFISKFDQDQRAHQVFAHEKQQLITHVLTNPCQKMGPGIACAYLQIVYLFFKQMNLTSN